jgi:hypothetical protein
METDRRRSEIPVNRMYVVVDIHLDRGESLALAYNTDKSVSEIPVSRMSTHAARLRCLTA